MTLEVAGYLLLFVTGLIGTAAFSGFETACYTVSRLRLILRENAGRRRSAILRREIARMPQVISTLLIGTNVSTYLVSFAVTAMLSEVFHLSDGVSIVLQGALLTPFLFLFGDTLPKELARSHADEVAEWAAPLIRVLRWILTWIGLLPILNLFSAALIRLAKSGEAEEQILSARASMSATLHEGVGVGIISPRQIDVVDRLIEARTWPVQRVMTPWSSVQFIEKNALRNKLLEDPAKFRRARYPLVDDESGNVVGVISLMELLTARAGESAESIFSEATSIRPDSTVSEALGVMRKTGASLAIVGTPEKPVGLVSRKDLLNPLIGSFKRI